MRGLLAMLTIFCLKFEEWVAVQPYRVRWAIRCAQIGLVVLSVELVMVLSGIWNWPILLITFIFFAIGTLTLYSDEFWNGPGGD